MVEIQRGHDATEGITGKSLHHIALYGIERPGPGPDKSVLDLVTEDGSVYRFTQLTSNDPFSFEPGQSSRDKRMSRSGRLPGVVEAVLDAELTDEDGDPNPGWIYS